jgi:PAS domain S-box-containing protein
MNHGLVIVNSEGEVVLSNAAAQRVFGATTRAMSFEQWRERFLLLREDKRTPYAVHERPLSRAIKGETVEVDNVYFVDRASSETMWLNITARPILDEEGAIQGAFGIFRDISRRHQIEEVLLLRNRAIASAAEGITIADVSEPGLPIIYANEGCERLTGYSSNEILGKNLTLLQGPDTDPEAVATINEAIQGGRSCTVELILHRKDGSPFWSRLSLTPVHDLTGRTTHFVGVQTDISALKSTEERLRSARDELRAAYDRIKHNLHAAAEVQRSLLPTHLPDFSWGSVAWRFAPCDELAGDILNIIFLDDDHIGAYVLDVCGHGIAAALLSVTVRRFLSPTGSPSSMVHRRETPSSPPHAVSPAEVANRLNQRFAWDADRGQFFTLFYGVLNTKTGHFRYCSAGHPPPYRVGKGRPPSLLSGSGFPIGVGSRSYEECQTDLEPGDRVLVYSDGATDAMNPNHDLFTDERLLDAFVDHADVPLEEALSGMMLRLDDWREDVPFHDDVSLLALEFGK